MQTDRTTITISSPPTPGVAQEWHLFLTTWGKAGQAVLPTFLLTRLLLLLLTYFGAVAFTVSTYSTFSLQLNTVFYSWYHWDAARFLGIVTQGYQAPETTAYFPLYPAIVQLFSKIFHLDLLLAGMLVANLAFLAALIVLYRFVTVEFDAETARRSVLYLAIFPTALFTFAAYSTSLLLCFLLLCVYLLRRAHWWLAGLCGALATLTDLAGFLLFIIFICEFVRQHPALFLRSSESSALNETPQYTTLIPSCSLLLPYLPLLAALFIPLGLAVYSLALQRQFGQTLAFLQFQDGSSRLSPPWTAPLGLLHNLSGSLFNFAGMHSFFEIILLLLFLLLTILNYIGPEHLRGDQWPLALFTLSMLLYTLLLPIMPATTHSTLDPLPSIQLTFLAAFTTIILLARLGRRSWLHQGYILFSLPMLAFLVLQLLANHWSL